MEESDISGGSLHGTWKNNWGEVFNINLGSNSFEYNGGFPGFHYKGDIHEIVYINNSGSAGFIFIEYTDIGDLWSVKEENGKITAVNFTFLADNILDLRSAVDVTSNDGETLTAKNLEIAKAVFTAGTLGNYFALGSVCIKQ